MNILSKLGNLFDKSEELLNTVTYHLGGLQWGWFGIVIGNPCLLDIQETVKRNTYGKRWYTYGVMARFNDWSWIFNDGVPYGTWHVGGVTDANHLRFTLDPVHR